jgi:hypothetical protein
VRSKGRDRVELVGLTCFGLAATTIWVKRSFVCVDPDYPMDNWTGRDDRIAAACQSLTTRAGRRATH